MILEGRKNRESDAIIQQLLKRQIRKTSWESGPRPHVELNCLVNRCVNKAAKDFLLTLQMNGLWKRRMSFFCYYTLMLMTRWFIHHWIQICSLHIVREQIRALVTLTLNNFDYHFYFPFTVHVPMQHVSLKIPNNISRPGGNYRQYIL